MEIVSQEWVWRHLLLKKMCASRSDDASWNQCLLGRLKVLACSLQAVQAFTLTPGLAAAHVLALAQLSAAGAPKAGGDSWTAGVLEACERHLGAFVDAFSRGDVDGPAPADRQTTTAIFTAGEVHSRSTSLH